MSFDRTGDTVTYSARRRWPGRRGFSTTVSVAIGDTMSEDSQDLRGFLTNRWRFYSRSRRGLASGVVDHDP